MLKPPYNYKGVPILPNSKSAYRPYRKGISPAWKILAVFFIAALAVAAIAWEIFKKDSGKGGTTPDESSAAFENDGSLYDSAAAGDAAAPAENPVDETPIRVVPPAGDNPTPEEAAMLVNLKKRIAVGDAEKVRKGLEERLLKMNPGDRLFLPYQELLSLASDELLKKGGFISAFTEYTVKRNDNLSVIALRHNVSVQTIRESNRLASDRLQIGQKLRIPGNSWEVLLNVAKQKLFVSESGRLVKIYSLRPARLPNLRANEKFILRAQNEEWNLYGLNKNDLNDLKRFVPLGTAVTITK